MGERPFVFPPLPVKRIFLESLEPRSCLVPKQLGDWHSIHSAKTVAEDAGENTGREPWIARLSA